MTLLNKFKKIFDRVKLLLYKKDTRKIIIAVFILIITLIILLISIIIFNGDKSEFLRDNSWKDFVINIDGNNIEMGNNISMVDTLGFSSNDENYNSVLNSKNSSGGLLFTYKEGNENSDNIFFSAFNQSDKELKISECLINGIEISDLFYKKYDVVLPGELILNDELNIKKIIKEWKKPSNKDDSKYEWVDDNGKIRIYTNNDGTIFSIVYEYNG